MKKGDGGGSLEQAPAFLGCCPQENPLWLELTPLQHLSVYAAVKGLQQEDAAAAVRRYTCAVHSCVWAQCQEVWLSPFSVSQLCVALSLVGNPSVLLLDEPSTSMDPNGQLCVWKTIRDALQSKESGAILTTHYMEEAEAVCDRVAILVSGQLRCIGSIQYLKNKFGRGYLLEIKAKDAESSDALHAEVLKIFPGAARQERFPSLLVYKVPMRDALPLSQSFSKLEEGKSKTR
ncbi:ABCA8 protein, partial [Nesospiza acunhae]|nr:ABCA8 protein [Nesospiza acunhae]